LEDKYFFWAQLALDLLARGVQQPSATSYPRIGSTAEASSDLTHCLKSFKT